jgi:hypothetical protein
MFQLKEYLVFTVTSALKRTLLSEICPQVNVLLTSLELEQWETDLLDLPQHLLGLFPYVSASNKTLCITW